LHKIDFLLKKFAGGFKPFTFVESSYLITDVCKFESSKKNERKAQSADSSKAYSKLKSLFHNIFMTDWDAFL